MGKWFEHFPKNREAIFLPIIEINISSKTYEAFAHFELRQMDNRNRILKLENFWRGVCGISYEEVKLIFDPPISDNTLSTVESIIDEIIKIDGNECHVTEIELWQVYKAFWNYLQVSDELKSIHIKCLMDFLSRTEKLLIEKYNKELKEATTLAVQAILSM